MENDPQSDSHDYEHNPWPGDPDYDDAVNVPPPATEPQSDSSDVWVLLDGEWFYRRGRPADEPQSDYPPMPTSEAEWRAHWAFYKLALAQRDAAWRQLERTERHA